MRKSQALLVAALLAGCTTAPQANNTAESTGNAIEYVVDETGEPDNVTVNAAEPTLGGDGSDIPLQPLTGADIEGAKLTGELACSFQRPGEPALLLAKGNVGTRDSAFGVVKVAGYVESVSAPGGFNAIVKGARFAGKGKTVTIALTGAATGGGESPPRPATLTFDRADGAKKEIAGEWVCGP